MKGIDGIPCPGGGNGGIPWPGLAPGRGKPCGGGNGMPPGGGNGKPPGAPGGGKGGIPRPPGPANAHVSFRVFVTMSERKGTDEAHLACPCPCQRAAEANRVHLEEEIQMEVEHHQSPLHQPPVSAA